MLAPLAVTVAMVVLGVTPSVAGASRGSARALASATSGLTVGFEINNKPRIVNATSLGVTTAIEYNGAPPVGSRLAGIFAKYHVSVIDARISDVLGEWECHRTHTVAPPPPGEEDWFCPKDYNPNVDSPAVVLAQVREWVKEDASNPLVKGYWVLDDWAPWDGGSGRTLLAEIHQVIDELTPGLPAICGFGGAIDQIGQTGGFESPIAANYSNAGCDAVGLYNYAEGVYGEMSSGENLDWSMSLLLGEEREALEAEGWVQADTPMIGINQGWSGRTSVHEYTPGLSVAQMVDEARAFCAGGAASIAWYGWGGVGHKAETSVNTPRIAEGVRQGLAACAEYGVG